MTRRRRLAIGRRSWWLIAPALAALSACAVATIDVDVYKGPLANTRRVQVEQMAVMVVGAKPLLLRLRNGLEKKKRGVDNLPKEVKDTFVCERGGSEP